MAPNSIQEPEYITYPPDAVLGAKIFRRSIDA